MKYWHNYDTNFVSPLEGDLNGHATSRQHSEWLGFNDVLDQLQTDDDPFRISNGPTNSLEAQVAAKSIV